MLSRPEIYARLAESFVGVLSDFYQSAHYKAKFGVHLGTGDQLFLDPQGNPIPTGKTNKEGKSVVVYGRHGLDTTAEVLDAIVAGNPLKSSGALKIEWFLYPDSYPWPNPARVSAVAQYARMPIAALEGPIPEAIRDSRFLQWHVRQFLWTRGKTEGASRIIVRRVRDGLKPDASIELGEVDGTLPPQEIGKALDALWMAYMKERPFTARGYHENPHGRWMRSVKEQMIGEDESLRRQALEGTLLAPGRKAGRQPPYLE